MKLLQQTQSLLTKHEKILTATASLVIIGTAAITIFGYARHRVTDLISNISYLTSANPDAIRSFVVIFLPYLTGTFIALTGTLLMSILANRVAESTRRQITNRINQAIKTDITPQLENITTKLAEAEKAAERLATREDAPRPVIFATGQKFTITGNYMTPIDPNNFYHFTKGQTAPTFGNNTNQVATTWELLPPQP